MRKIVLTTASVLLLSGCADATRTYPVLVVEHRPISTYEPRPRIVVPADRYYLPPPGHIRQTYPPMPPRRPCFAHDTHCWR